MVGGAANLSRKFLWPESQTDRAQFYERQRGVCAIGKNTRLATAQRVNPNQKHRRIRPTELTRFVSSISNRLIVLFQPEAVNGRRDAWGARSQNREPKRPSWSRALVFRMRLARNGYAGGLALKCIAVVNKALANWRLRCGSLPRGRGVELLQIANWK
jgi:hypothetical protein